MPRWHSRTTGPDLLARAMVDSSIEVIEVNQAAKRLFIEPVNKKPDQQVVRTWNKAGSLLTLTAEEAVECTIADGLVGSREQLLQQLAGRRRERCYRQENSKRQKRPANSAAKNG